MRKQVFGRQFKRDTNERKALFKGLVSSLVMHERIETTEEKAKAIKGHVEKLVTKAKKNDSVHAKNILQAYLTHEALQKLLNDVAPRFADRPGGYTRIIKLGSRFSDNASMALIEWVEKASTAVVPKAAKKTTSLTTEVVATAPVATAPKSKKVTKVTASKTTTKKKAVTKKKETK